MKRNIFHLIFVTCITVFLLEGNLLQAQTKLIVVINEASWCKYCKANGERVRNGIADFVKNKEIIVIHNDVSNKETIQKNEGEFKKLGIAEYMKSHQEAAMIYILDSSTKKGIDGLPIKSEDSIIINALEEALMYVKK
ncbi:MAG: hypothetical protein MUF42_10225 [Cytophagaceae bacterium]|jgi:hypothetical protein|nr:hypothetical protein [Cytophagaceae bacterium]